MPQLWAMRLCTSRQWCWTLLVTLSMVMALQPGLCLHHLKLRLALILLFACCSYACVIINDLEEAVRLLLSSYPYIFSLTPLMCAACMDMGLGPVTFNTPSLLQRSTRLNVVLPSLPCRKFLPAGSLPEADLTAVLLLLHLMPYPQESQRGLPTPPLPFLPFLHPLQHEGKQRLPRARALHSLNPPAFSIVFCSSIGKPVCMVTIPSH